MFCKECGQKNNEGAKFCKECGTPIGGAADRQIKKQQALLKRGRLRENQSLRKLSFYGAALPQRASYSSLHIKPERTLLLRTG